jgi:cytidyltransferase-like protein
MFNKRKVIIYGGTFSPPHIGHIDVARAVAEQEKPDELLIIPTFLPPHKNENFGAENFGGRGPVLERIEFGYQPERIGKAACPNESCAGRRL